MTKASNNEFPSILFAEEDPPSAPATGFRRLFLNASNVNVIGSNSSVRALAWSDAISGSGDVATDAIWDAKGDLAVATAANTAQKLTVGGTNDHVLTVASGETTGLKWAHAALTYASSDLGADASTLTNAYADIVTVSLAAGTWLVSGQLVVLVANQPQTLNVVLTDGSNNIIRKSLRYSNANQYFTVVLQPTVLVLASSGGAKLRAAGDHATNAGTPKGTTSLSAAGTGIVAVRIA